MTGGKGKDCEYLRFFPLSEYHCAEKFFTFFKNKYP